MRVIQGHHHEGPLLLKGCLEMQRYYYSEEIELFLLRKPHEILGMLARENEFALEQTQRTAWEEEIRILKAVLPGLSGKIFFEFSIPRMGKRIDVVLLVQSVIFVLEFKVGSQKYDAGAIDQVWDYALDLKNFHETSHKAVIAPIVVATEAENIKLPVEFEIYEDRVLSPSFCNATALRDYLDRISQKYEGDVLDLTEWGMGAYQPTPTIIEAAKALYAGQSVEEISRTDAGAKNLSVTTAEINQIIEFAREKRQKVICFVTGVPGAGKTLVGLNIATQNIDKDKDLYSVFLSGNGPLVAVLREALARDQVQRSKEMNVKQKLGEARRDVKVFIQNVHNFRDESLRNMERPPLEHVALFDEAQRAWNLQQTANFMKRKKGLPGFSLSEPEFLISCMDRHPDWAVIVCLVGGGQEINTGEAGISEWIDALQRSYPEWKIHISPRLTDSEYGAGEVLKALDERPNVSWSENLHLAVSMRSFRSEKVSLLVKQVLDLETNAASETLAEINRHYPIVITRDLQKAKTWLRQKARASERFGLLVSSEAIRLKPLAVDVRASVDPIHWFLDPKEDIRSSYYLEDVATEFQVQGLEVDWACVIWDGDFRCSKKGWEYRSFVGSKWNHINKEDRKVYLKNAYRVLLTRARQGMVIVVPDGDQEDPTRAPAFYDPTFSYLRQIGFQEI